MPLLIIDLINMPELRTRLLSGAQGITRPVYWAHVCELSDPTEWMGEGDLLMTTGIGIPEQPEAQQQYVESLSLAGLAGIIIGEHMQAPNNLSALQHTAEQLGFPLLMMHYGVPFSSVTRAIIDANRNEEFEQRKIIAKIYTSARMAIEGLPLETLLLQLEKDIQAKLMLLEPHTLTPLLPKSAKLSAELMDSLLHQCPDSAHDQPVVRRYTLEDGNAFGIALPFSQWGVLIVYRCQHHLLDYNLLHHLVVILGIALERMQMESERTLRLGSELLDDLSHQRLSLFHVETRLKPFRITLTSAQLAVARSPKQSLSHWSLQLERMGIRVLLRAQGEELIILLPADMLPGVHASLGLCMGVSNLVEHPERFPESLREARLALAHSNHEQPMVIYAQMMNRLPWLPQSLEEATQTFRRILGTLADYDQQQGAPLLYTLRVFLEQNRSWLNAARCLHIHKTTLTYRIRRIESITGRSLNRTEDVAILWLALQAADIVEPQRKSQSRKKKAD